MIDDVAHVKRVTDQDSRRSPRLLKHHRRGQETALVSDLMESGPACWVRHAAFTSVGRPGRGGPQSGRRRHHLQFGVGASIERD